MASLYDPDRDHNRAIRFLGACIVIAAFMLMMGLMCLGHETVTHLYNLPTKEAHKLWDSLRQSRQEKVLGESDLSRNA